MLLVQLVLYCFVNIQFTCQKDYPRGVEYNIYGFKRKPN